jgi:hypothetical protein
VSNRPDEFRHQIGTLLSQAMGGLDTMREVVVRSAQTGRLRFDIALLRNERALLYQRLGEEIFRLVEEQGYDDASETLRPLIDQIKEVEGRIRSDSARATDNAFGAPRGYEPEAASDYGDADLDGEAEEEEPPPPPKKKGASRKKK